MMNRFVNLSFKFNLCRFTMEIERAQVEQAAELNRIVAAGFERQEQSMVGQCRLTLSNPR
jgi:hypothetical protein